MTRDEIRKRFHSVQKLYKPTEDEMILEEKPSERYWTEEDMLVVAKKILRRLGLDESILR